MIDLQSILVRFGGVIALNSVSAQFSQDVSGIIGPNGAGKTTLMNVISGFVTCKSGSVDVDGQNLLQLSPHRRSQWGLRRSFQKEQIADDLSVFDNVLVQLDFRMGQTRENALEVEKMLDAVGMTDHANRLGAELSGFERRLTDVARCMVGAPRLIMLDEPAGGLSVDETHQLGAYITNIPQVTGGQVLVIDHDVELISAICKETLVLDFGKRIAFGKTAEVLADPKVKSAYLGTEEVSA